MGRIVEGEAEGERLGFIVVGDAEGEREGETLGTNVGVIGQTVIGALVASSSVLFWATSKTLQCQNKERN